MSGFKLKYSTLTLLCILLCSTLIISQEALDSFDLSINLDDVVITGQYAPTHYSNSLYKIKVIKTDQIKSRAFTTLDQVLQFDSNIKIQYDPALGNSIKLRGVESNSVAILIDGVPIIGRLDGAIDLSQISMANIERVEIIEGTQSLLYGNNATGGVINLISKKSQLKKIETELSALAETNGVQNLMLRTGLRHKQFLLNLHGNYLNDQNMIDDSLRVFETFEFEDGNSMNVKKYPWNPKIQWSSGASLRYDFLDNHRLILSSKWTTEEVRNLGELRRPQFMPYALDEVYSTQRYDYSLHYDGQLTDSKYLQIDFAYNQFYRSLTNERYEFELGAIDPEMSTVDSSFFDAQFFKVMYSDQIKPKWQYMIGGQYNNESGEGERIENLTEGESLEIKEASVFTQIKFAPSKNFTSSIGTRNLWNRNYGFISSPSFQAKWDFTPFSLKFGYSHGFRSPGLKELYLNFIDVNHDVVGNPDLEAEKSVDYNLSLEWAKKKKDLNLSASANVFHTVIDNKIILAQINDTRFTYQNLEQFISKGVGIQLGSSYRNFQLDYQSNLIFIDNDLTLNSQEVGSITNFDMSTTLQYRIPKIPVNVSVAHRYFNSQVSYFLDAFNELRQSILAPYQFLDANIQTKLFNDNLSIAIGAKNLLDNFRIGVNNANVSLNHTDMSNDALQIVNKGRSFFISLNYNFGLLD